MGFQVDQTFTEGIEPEFFIRDKYVRSGGEGNSIYLEAQGEAILRISYIDFMFFIKLALSLPVDTEKQND